MEAYIHTVQYYETDKMGITHHSNYIRMMEEARLAFLESIGWPYAKMEEEGVISPVVAVECRYLATTTYPDKIRIQVRIREFKGVRLKIAYTMYKEDGTKAAEASSEHCFLDAEGRPIRMKKVYPELYRLLTGLAEADHREAEK